MQRVLVTGGLGFIGSNLVSVLDELGVRVVVVDDLSSARDDIDVVKKSLPRVEFIESCFASPEILDRIKDGEFETVFHVAAIPRVSLSVEQPALTTHNNVTKSVDLLEACRGNIRRFIFSSSSSVYGGADQLPTPVDHPKNPKSPYAWQKSCLEDLICMFCQLYDLDAVCLRYFNVFGPGQFGGGAYSTAISSWCHAIKHDLPLRKDGSGEQSRDMCYIDNVVNANILAMKSDKKFMGEKFNVACGDRTSNNQILEALKERFGELKVHQVPFRKGDVMHTQADTSMIARQLGYEPLVRFWEGFEKTLAWWELSGD